MMTQRSYHNLGFTLVELILVIVLLGILSAVAAPRFFQRSSFDARVLFDDTLNALRYTQKIAVATGCQTQFVVTDNSYSLLKEQNCGDGDFTADSDEPNKNKIANPVSGAAAYQGEQANISLSASRQNTTFTALGHTVESTDNVITIGHRTITIIAATGFSYDSTP